VTAIEQQRDQVAMAASFDAENAEAIVRIMKPDAFDQAG
jgi:hypothetical protein